VPSAIPSQGAVDHGQREWQQRKPVPTVEGGAAGVGDPSGDTDPCRSFPPGTGKWNKIEHPMFCHITQNWRGCPQLSHEVVLNSDCQDHDDNSFIVNSQRSKG
jgi:hypothetical protein